MGEILRSEVDKMDADRELQTQLRCVHQINAHQDLSFTLQ